MAKKVVMEGNVAIAEAAIRGGCRFFAGYPITPATAMTEYMSNRMYEVGGEFVQAESECASVFMVQGASAVGARAMSGTSGQGFALMTEGMSILNAQNFPAVIVDCQRGGAGGCPIFPSQSDYNFATKSVGHGGYRAYVLAPGSTQEAVDLMYDAFDFAEENRCLVLFLTDGMMGQMMEAVELPPFKTVDMDKPYAATGCRGRKCRRVGEPLSQTEEDSKAHDAMYKRWAKEALRYEDFMTGDADVVVVAWGSVARTCRTPIKKLRSEGYRVGMLRPITLHPFPYEQIAALRGKRVIVMENSVPAQLYLDVDYALKGSGTEISLYTRSMGNMISPEEAEAELRKLV